ncbi:MAG: hypothetical protein GY856_35160 [bacterium]|nr:hypothetical protein [bacterium]
MRIKKKNQLALEKMIRRGRLRPVMPSRLLEIAPGSVRLEADGRETRLDNAYVFVLIGGEPPFLFLRRLGIRFGQCSPSKCHPFG